jgi:hypothetical protein
MESLEKETPGKTCRRHSYASLQMSTRGLQHHPGIWCGGTSTLKGKNAWDFYRAHIADAQHPRLHQCCPIVSCTASAQCWWLWMPTCCMQPGQTGSAACFKTMPARKSMLLRNHSTLDMRNSGGWAERTFLGFQLSWMSLDLEPLFQKVAHCKAIHDQIW